MWLLQRPLLFLPCILLLAAKCTGSNSNSLRAVNVEKVPPLFCHITLELTTKGDATNDQIVKQYHHFECAPVLENDGGTIVSDISYGVDLPDQFVEDNQTRLRSGNLFVKITNGKIFNGNIEYPADDYITVVPPPESLETSRRRQRRLQTSGTSQVLVLRITAADSTNTFSTQQLTNYIFDASQPYTKPTLTSQFALMSFGKLSFVPTSYGVMDVTVPLNATGSTATAIRDAAITAVQQKYNVASITTLADHVILCIPPGTGDWSGTSSIQAWRIVLNDQWCGYLSGLMREMGHNLGLGNANVGASPYMDFTSYMSAAFATVYWPAKSFNGANNWQLGWYSDRQVTVLPALGGQAVMLATFVDYNKSQKNLPVLIQIGASTYLQYNRAKSFNSEAQQMVDQVTVVQQLGSATNLIGGIDLKNPQLGIPNFDGSGRYLVLYICGSGMGNDSNPDWILVSIGYDMNYCSQAASFQPVTPPTPPPTMRPTMAPTKRPTPVPSAKPTTPPTSKPTAAPVKRTRAPATAPTAADARPTRRKPTVATAPCYDTTASFFVVNYGNEGCIWLAARSAMQTKLCSQTAVQTACPRTCKVCTSSCNDSAAGTFLDNSGAKRTCLWLSLRTNKLSTYCQRSDVSALCPVACKSC